MFCVHIDSDDIAKWETERQLLRLEAELEAVRPRSEAERIQHIQKLYRELGVTVAQLSSMYSMREEETLLFVKEYG